MVCCPWTHPTLRDLESHACENVEGELAEDFEPRETWPVGCRPPNSTGTDADLERCDVVALSLAANRLQGTLPSKLSVLDRLTYLELSRNSLSGSLPAELDFPSLQYLPSQTHS